MTQGDGVVATVVLWQWFLASQKSRLATPELKFTVVSFVPWASQAVTGPLQTGFAPSPLTHPSGHAERGFGALLTDSSWRIQLVLLATLRPFSRDEMKVNSRNCWNP